MRRIVLTFGLLAGAVLAALMVVNVALPERILFEHGATYGYTTMVVAYLLVFFGIRSYRDTVGGGTIGFGRAVGVGLLITLIASACYVVTWQVLHNLVWPDFADRYAEHALSHARQSGATPEQLAAKAREMADFKTMYANPVYNVAWTFAEVFPVGLIMTLVSAGILRRREPPRPTGTTVGTTQPAL